VVGYTCRITLLTGNVGMCAQYQVSHLPSTVYYDRA